MKELITLDTFLIILSCFFILLVLFIDYSFYRKTHPVYMTNQSHVNLYTLPLLISYSLFTLAIVNDNSRNLFSILILTLFTGVYIFLVGQYKIILKGAIKEEVLEELNNFLKGQEKIYKIYQVSDNYYSCEINNYKDALTIRDMDKWIEIDSIIHKDDKFLNDLNNYFYNKARDMKSIVKKPNIFFYLLILFNLLILIGIFYFNSTMI